MSTGSINNNLSYLQSIMNTTLQSAGLPTATSGNTSTSAVSQQSDNTQLSPFAQVMSELQQLQQSDPAKYQQVTKQISANLQTAAQTAQQQGNTTAAAQLNQLSTDFSNASQSGQLPSVQDLAQAIGGGHHHHGHHHAASADNGNTGTSSTSSTSSSTSTTNSLLSQIQSAFQTGSSQSAGSLDPMSIINQVLVNSGATSPNTV
jgi:hypothetical protein